MLSSVQEACEHEGNSSKDSRKPAWMNKNLLTQLQYKKEAYKRLKKGEMALEK